MVLENQGIRHSPVWKKLKEHAEFINRPENHLKFLLKDKKRLSRFSLKAVDVFYDYSRQRVDDKAMDLLYELAEKTELHNKFKAMVSGEIINTTEKRAALHTAARNFSDNPIRVDGVDIMPDIENIRQNIKEFSEKIHRGDILGSSGKPFKHVVVIGIGGSYLGSEFVAQALFAFARKNIRVHFLTNVDSHHFETIKKHIDPEATLWIIISKSFTTVETHANMVHAQEYVKSCGLDVSKHFVTVTSKGSPGDNPDNPVLQVFHMFDYIGGRFSVTSAVGGVPLSLYLGYNHFERFLQGAYEMDIHTKYAPIHENIPLVSALIGIWNVSFLHYHSQAIIPYASPLSRLAPHIQQLSMESNGKMVDTKGAEIHEQTGEIIFGEPGTNAQHSFFQLAHQGQPFPIEFIGVITPQYPQGTCRPNGVSNHQELWANMISQANALAIGKDSKDRVRLFKGNRPSSTLVLNDISPTNIGRLLSYYETQTVYKAFVWDINPFDQFGVELGKTMADDLRKEMVQKNTDPDHSFTDFDPITEFYLDMLYEGKV